jgi:GAF domain-containing protein
MPSRQLARAAAFARMSEDIMSDADETSTLQRVVDRCVGTVPACEHASVSLHRRKDSALRAATSSAPAECCLLLQHQLEDGPSVRAWPGEDFQLVRDTKDEDRWPTWCRALAREEGIGSLLSVRLTAADGPLGVLNLYAAGPDAFTEDDLDLALVFASHAAMAINAARQVTGLQTAVESRHLIGVAQGVLMARHDLTVEQAFELLRRYSSTSNVKLRDVAAEVVRQRGVPGP